MNYEELYGGNPGGGGGGAGKAASSSSSASSAINFAGDSIFGADGGLSPLGLIVLGVGAMMAFVTLIVVAKR